MKSTKATLLSFLKARLDIAKDFTKKKFIEDSKKSIDDYNFAKFNNLFMPVDTDKIALAANRRYNQTLPVIFTYVEALKASVFDRYLDIVIKQRGKDDEDKALIIKATYAYLKDKLNLENFQLRAFEWFALLGFVSAHTSFKSEFYETPLTNDNGEEEIDENGEMVMLPVYTFNDPVVKLNKYDKVFYSPESEFEDSDNASIPYFFIQDIITEDEAKNIYGKKVEADISLSNEDEDFDSKEHSRELKRVGVYHYYGNIPSEYKKEVQNWDVDNKYYCVFSEKKILAKPEFKPFSPVAIGKFLGLPDTFFGFGYGKIGRYFQQEKSVRRGQQTRLADLAAFPKWLIKDDGTTDIDFRALSDPRALPFLKYKGNPPELSRTPNLAEVVTASEQSANNDAQQAFGILDLVASSQEGSTVGTATGQSIFADASNKRIKLAKSKFGRFYLQVVINLFKLCAENWEDEKVVTLTDDQGNSQDVTLTKDKLKNIDFDSDLVINVESQSVNKDIQKAQNIELYDRTKDDPTINRKEIMKKLLRENYNIKDTEKYFTQSQIPPGTQLTDQMGNQFIADETGQVVPAEAQMNTARPSGGNVPSSQSGIMGANQNVER